MQIVEADHEFTFPGRCPFCKADLIARAEGWEKDENGQWKADQFAVNCAADPGPENLMKWYSHQNDHWELLYEIWHPVVRAITNEIAAQYRFNL